MGYPLKRFHQVDGQLCKVDGQLGKVDGQLYKVDGQLGEVVGMTCPLFLEFCKYLYKL